MTPAKPPTAEEVAFEDFLHTLRPSEVANIRESMARLWVEGRDGTESLTRNAHRHAWNAALASRREASAEAVAWMDEGDLKTLAEDGWCVVHAAHCDSGSDHRAALPLYTAPPAPQAVILALQEERRKFQQETLRSSALIRALSKWVTRHEQEHTPGAWSRDCDLCALVGESKTLLERPLDPAAAPETTQEPAPADREELLGDAIRALIRGDIRCSNDLPPDRRPVHVSARRAFGAVHRLLAASSQPAKEVEPNHIALNLKSILADVASGDLALIDAYPKIDALVAVAPRGEQR